MLKQSLIKKPAIYTLALASIIRSWLREGVWLFQISIHMSMEYVYEHLSLNYLQLTLYWHTYYLLSRFLRQKKWTQEPCASLRDQEKEKLSQFQSRFSFKLKVMEGKVNGKYTYGRYMHTLKCTYLQSFMFQSRIGDAIFPAISSFSVANGYF